MVFIYFIERREPYRSRVRPLFDAIDRQQLTAVTSTVTLTEVMTRPLRLGNHELAEAYRSALLNTPALLTLPVSARIAEEAADLRALHNLRTPDALQLATATVARAQFFITNDARLQMVREPRVLLLDDMDPVV
jgi:predicted nucleic acid-binding protein